jgi:uncharacterized peroxidase-related enzyme
MALSVKPLDTAHSPVLAALERSAKQPSHLYSIMAHNPEALERFAGFESLVMGPGSVSPRIKELAFLAASFVNESDYCMARHVESALKAGISKDEIREIRTEQNQNFNLAERAAIVFSRELTRTAEVEDQIHHAMQENFSARQIVEILLVACLANFTNRFSNALSLRPDENEVRAAG